MRLAPEISTPLRFIWIPFSLYFLVDLVSRTLTGTIQVAYHLTEDNPVVRTAAKSLAEVAWVLILLTSIAYVAKEVADLYVPSPAASRFLRQLRYGPAFVWISSILIVIAFDIAMIEVSKYQIRSYVFQSTASLEEPELGLHNNYRHWCGNGVSATDNSLYFETAASGIDDADPYVRARSLMMAAQVGDWINGGDKRFESYLKNACQDSDPVVSMTARSLSPWRDISCAEISDRR